jgi:hypoxanthine-guanine phosphoribosyltransferase
LIVEDMIDTGGTLYFVEEFLSGNAWHDYAVLYEKEGHNFKTNNNVFSVKTIPWTHRIDFYYES